MAWWRSQSTTRGSAGPWGRQHARWIPPASQQVPAALRRWDPAGVG